MAAQLPQLITKRAGAYKGTRFFFVDLRLDHLTDPEDWTFNEELAQRPDGKSENRQSRDTLSIAGKSRNTPKKPAESGIVDGFYHPFGINGNTSSFRFTPVASPDPIPGFHNSDE